MVRYFSLFLVFSIACCWFAFEVSGEDAKPEKKGEPATKQETVKQEAPSAVKAAGEIDFVKEIQPILKKSCYSCHGSETQEAGLRLDIKKKALAGGDSGPGIIPGKSEKSRLIELVSGLDKKVGGMPPEDEGDPLTKEQITLLKKWIDNGATWPDNADPQSKSGDAEKYWAYQPIVSPSVPKVKNSNWVRNPIDAFILEKMEAENVAPAPEADRVTLLRRVYLDLIGLPPTPEQVEEFLKDKDSKAYEHVVDKLLESQHYGERWGRHWLDVARYADSDGFEKDTMRLFAWRYRDWVIHAHNQDLPFDIFTVQQLAGDLLKEGDREYSPSARVATGFHRNTLLNKEGGVDPEEDRVKRTIDRTNTLGVAWLGMSVGCANCHTHKYDPITQKEYFELYAFMNNIKEVDLSVSAADMEVQQLDTTPRESLPDEDETKEKDPSETIKEKTKPLDKQAIKAAAKLKAKREQDKKNEFRLFQAVTEMSKPRNTYVHLRGDFLSKGPEVEPNTLEVLPPLKKRADQADRLDLARWLVSSSHPLTSRVIVNRIWLNHFGRGLYVTVDDFGKKQNEPPYEEPSHPKLLDWLACQFRDNGWSMKRLHKLIVTSATYRQSAAARPELVDRDPYNSWLARQNRLRVEAEIIRDMALTSSGLLAPKIGGPSVRPPQPPGVSELTYSGTASWNESKGQDRYRRGLYIWFQRTSPYPSLVTFDAPEANLACTRRDRSDTPLQSLTLLNDTTFMESAQALGKLMTNEAVDASSKNIEIVDRRIQWGFQRCLARTPTAIEQKMLRKLYDDTLKMYLKDSTSAAKFIGEAESHETNDKSTIKVKSIDTRLVAETAANVAVARVIMNLDEFLTRE